jgi:hypothetical protein
VYPFVELIGGKGSIFPIEMSTVSKFGDRATIRRNAGRRKSTPVSAFPKLTWMERRFIGLASAISAGSFGPSLCVLRVQFLMCNSAFGWYFWRVSVIHKGICS